MKKIGQLTFHGAHNYGSVLQAYALSKKLRNLGYDTEIINLRPQSQKNEYKIIRDRDKGIHKIFRCCIYYALKKRYDNYERFISNFLPLTEKEYSSTDELSREKFSYDAYICGGDQIWNPFCQDFETAYYLQFLHKNCDARKISYAPSFGKKDFDSATLNKIANWIKDFDFVSVREESGADIIRKISEKTVQTVCDPVLLLDAKEWEEIAIKPKYNKPYILVYFLENNHGDRRLTEYLRKMTGYEVVVLNEYIRDFFRPYHKAYTASPEEFVGLFQNASLVYTNSFHGTVFSTIFERPFITAIAENQMQAVNNNDSRKIDYLKKIKLESRLYTRENPNKRFVLQVDYAYAKEILDQFRKESLEFLKNSLK